MTNSKSLLTLGLVLACGALTLSLAVRSQAQTINFLAAFNGTNGEDPSSVIQATDGNFYGTTIFGGPALHGNVVRITPAGEISTLYDFCSRPHCLDGANPYTPPILGSDGNLYGVTAMGGSTANGGAGWGTVYKLTLDGHLTTLYAFCTGDLPCLDGLDPVGLVQAADGTLYGTAFEGGQFNGGTLFKLTPAGKFSLVHIFCSSANCADGQWPESAPIQGSDGNLYGVTLLGGKADAGVLYDLTPAGRFNVVHTFLCFDDSCNLGGEPNSVMQDAAGNLFGATGGGGAFGEGTIFEITPQHQYLNLYTFTESSPLGLTRANDGNFYGLTGGINGAGTIFQFTQSGTFNTLFTFTCCTAGSNPGSTIFQAPDGNLYGSVAFYGDQTYGAIYSFSNGLNPLVQTNPTTGKVGRSVIILGNGLTGSTSVTFNGVAAEFTVESDTYIKAAVPTGATTGTVSVVTPAGTLNSNPEFVVTK
jgi:uncharacterized repeat protein (TIGR03803 family)